MRDLVVYTLMFSAMLQLLMAAYAWGRRHEPAAKPLIMMFVLGSIWAFAYGMDMASSHLQTKIFWTKIFWTAAGFGPLVFLWIVLDHLESSHLLTRWRLALLFLPSLSIITLAWSMPHHDLLLYDFSVERSASLDILQFKHGALYFPLLLILQGISIISYYLLIRSLSTVNQIKRRQSITILFALLVPFLVNIPTILNVNLIEGFDFTPHALVFSSALFAYAIFRYHWLDILPLARTTLVEIIPVGVIVVDAKARIVDINPYAQTVLNLSSGAIIGKNVRAALGTLLSNALVEDEVDQGKKELRVENLNGKTEYFDIEIVPLKDRSGKINGRLFHFTNITGHKENELRLLQLAQTVEQSPASVIITDLEGSIVYVNPQFTKLTGYAFNEAIGKKTNIVQSGQTPDAVYRDLWQTIKSGRNWHGEFLNRKKNGELYWELAVIAPVIDSEGNIANFIAVKEDITQRKQAESALQEANKHLQEQLVEIESLHAQLHEQAMRDHLTGLYNRRYMNDVLERETHRAIRHQHPLSMLMIEIDFFKRFNDSFGHAAGDATLEQVAELIRANTRADDVACRFGGDEFTLIMPETTLESAWQCAERLRESAAHLQLVHKEKPLGGLTLSIGVAVFPKHGKTAASVLQAADEAMYQAKQKGKNRVIVAQE